MLLLLLLGELERFNDNMKGLNIILLRCRATFFLAAKLLRLYIMQWIHVLTACQRWGERTFHAFKQIVGSISPQLRQPLQ